MTMKLGICTNFITENKYCLHEELWGSLKDNFDYVEFPAFPLMDMSDDAFAEFIARCCDYGLTVRMLTNIFPPGINVFSDPFPIVSSYVSKLLDRAEALCVQHLVFGSGPSRIRPDEMPEEKADEIFSSIIMDLLVPSGKEILIEPLRVGNTNYINSIARAAAVKRLCGSDNVNIVADSYNVMESDYYTDIIRFGDHIKHIHISDEGRQIRTGSFSEKLELFFSALQSIGYDGTASLECQIRFDSSLTDLLCKIRKVLK